MAFTPARDTYYRIHFKHSNKCFGVNNQSPHRGDAIVQQASVTGDHQLFQIRAIGFEDHFAISPKNSGHNFDVPQARRDNGVALIQWDRGEEQWHQRFRFVRTSDGFYKLQAVHSEKFLVAKDSSTGDGALIVQADSSDSDAGKFKILPDGVAFDSITGRDLVQSSSELTRTAIIGIASLAPQVGSGLRFMLNLLWPSQNVGLLVWTQMKQFVLDLVRDVVDQAKLQILSDMLEGIRNVLKLYEDTSFDSPQKGQYFTSLLTALNTAKPHFFNAQNPEKLLPFFVSLGTLHLAALREQSVNYNDIYRQADPDRAKNLKLLQDTITEYAAAARTIGQRALAWRKAKIGIRDWSEQSGISRNYYWKAYDEYDGWSAQFSQNNTTSESGGSQRKAETAFNNRVTQVENAWGAELERFLSPAYLWKYLDPTKSDKPTRVPVDIKTGPWGGGRETPFEDDPKGKTITAVRVYAGTKVDGIEIFYDGVSGGLHGAAGGNRYHYDLLPGERIAGLRLRAGEAIDALWFETTAGRRIGGGGRGGIYYIGDPPDDANATLYSIAGRQGSAHLAAISCTWRYYRDQ